jgi:type I restriction enzyme R subunit
MGVQFCESNLESTVVERLLELGYSYGIVKNAWATERKIDSFIDEAVLFERLTHINNGVKHSIIEDAVKIIAHIDVLSLFDKNHKFHNYLTDGITIEDFALRVNPLVRLIDYDNTQNNTFEVYNQLKFKEYNNTRIPDVIIYINGLPLVIFELKSPEYREDTFLENAYNQLGANTESGGYRYDIPTLFNYNAFLVISDGATSKVGTLARLYAV